jgi:predicted alpha/beta-hydrolase family hydrolase
MLFIQGTRDRLAEHGRMTQVVSDLGPSSTLLVIHHADHDFKVLVRSGRTSDEAMVEMLDGLVGWLECVLKSTR